MSQLTTTQDPTQAAIARYVALGPMGLVRLAMIRSGIKLEVRIPGMRLTRKAPKCSTILRQEFGLRGKPAALLDAFEIALATAGVLGGES